MDVPSRAASRMKELNEAKASDFATGWFSKRVCTAGESRLACDCAGKFIDRAANRLPDMCRDEAPFACVPWIRSLDHVFNAPARDSASVHAILRFPG